LCNFSTISKSNFNLNQSLKEKLKILLFSTKGAGNHYYGPGMSAYRLYRRKNNETVSVSLIHGYINQENLSVFDEQIFIANLKSGDLLSGICFLGKLRKWIKNNANRFDVVHCLGGYHTSFMMAKLCEEQGVPAFIKITESVNTGFNKSSAISNILGLKKYRVRHANDITGYISISSKINKQLISAGIGASKIFNIPNGVDVDLYKPLSVQEKMNLRSEIGFDNTFTIIFTGAFSSRKNPYLIVKAFAKYYNSKKIQLIMIGPDGDGGEERNRIQNVLREYNVKNVHILPFTHDILKYYHISDIFVLPSTEEGLSNSMLEAQACGLPAVVTKISGSEDLIDESCNGQFVSLDEESIISGIDRYYERPDILRIHSINAREKIVEQYSAAEVYNKQIELFNRYRLT